MPHTKIRRALISVSDKEQLIELAQGLAALNIKILSTGGTYKTLEQAQINTTEVSNYTGFPEMMDGRVKTLHPKIHAGILARRGTDDKVLEDANIKTIDLVIVNLYPFAETLARADCTHELAIENIDIGGPTMVRAAAKNYKDVAIVVNSQDYQPILNELQQTGDLSADTRFDLARKAFAHTAAYEAMIANYFQQQNNDEQDQFPEQLQSSFQKQQNLRYGENPHQQAAFYADAESDRGTLAQAKQLQGKELSFNNIVDTDAALEAVQQFQAPACAIVKHANPCGVALGDNLEEAYQRAYRTDPTSAFGGIIAFNQTLDANTAKVIIKQQFVEVIIAPEVSPEALQALSAKSNLRVLSAGYPNPDTTPKHDYKKVNGGLLMQTQDTAVISAKDLKIVSQRAPTPEEINDLLFCWKVAKFVKSNAIVHAKDNQTLAIGAGQMSRVYSAKIAKIKAADEQLEIKGSVMASDAFFPFRDGIDTAAESGVNAIIQPGGSIRDEEVIAAADQHNIAMVFTGIRHFRH